MVEHPAARSARGSAASSSAAPLPAEFDDRAWKEGDGHGPDTADEASDHRVARRRRRDGRAHARVRLVARRRWVPWPSGPRACAARSASCSPPRPRSSCSGVAELVTLYNDAYRPVFGAKHPAALGQPARECWREVWDVLGPLFEGVMRTGEAFWAKRPPLLPGAARVRRGDLLRRLLRPVRDETGGVGGVFCIVSETTGRVLGERRLRTLRELGARPGGRRTARPWRRAAAGWRWRTPGTCRSPCYLLDDAGASARLGSTCGLQPGSARPRPRSTSDAADADAAAPRRGGARPKSSPPTPLATAAGRRGLRRSAWSCSHLVRGSAVARASWSPASSRYLALERRLPRLLRPGRRADRRRRSRTRAPTRRSASAPRRWPSWTGPRPPSSATSATSSARR